MSPFYKGRRKVRDLSDRTPEEQKEYYRNRLLYYLERLRTLREARQFLKEIGCPPDWADELVQMAEEYRFLDDAAYARSYVADALKIRHASRRQIRYQLRLKGIQPELAEEALEECPVSDEETAAYLVSRRLKDPSDEAACTKCASFLIRRGFTYETVKKVLPQAEPEDDASFEENSSFEQPK